jgi:hypothetical protein
MKIRGAGNVIVRTIQSIATWIYSVASTDLPDYRPITLEATCLLSIRELAYKGIKPQMQNHRACIGGTITEGNNVS